MTSVSYVPCRVLEWDTAFFGFRIAQVTGDVLTQNRILQIDEWCEQNEVTCLYFLAYSNDATTVSLAEDSHFRFVDIRMTFAQEIQLATGATHNVSGSAVQIRRARAADIPPLQEIARESHRDTRFFYDRGFPLPLSEALYATWIERSCTGFADQVLVGDSEGGVLGYVSCHLDAEHRTGRIGLIAVSSQARRKAIGQALVQSALVWFATQGVKMVSVTTQGRNCAAQRLFQRCGFLTQTVELWYHKWYIDGR
jgi:dTDP-4-amino-4,6-dideoxy-D-galactose acyltransferase